MSNPKILLLLDEDVWVGLATALQNNGYDAISVNEIGRKGLSDEEQMAFAALEERAIITHNVGDFVSIAQRYFYQKNLRYGVIIAPHIEKGALLRRTLALLDSLSQEALMNTVRFV
ncbi:DUF5615 family PIN-like protein [Anaerolineales bacterium HSG25]|nr:DUF5615 family PIN-like protein [Anaerolineales bacterium HSG25]